MEISDGRYYDSKHNRIIYINNEATPDMWHNRWRLNEHSIKKYFSKTDKRVIKITSRYLKPQDGVILEGGCGYGGIVNSLNQVGYKVIGMDFDSKTVSFLNKNVSHLDIRLGDVRSLNEIVDSSVVGYWSLGVIEHFYNGFADIAKEMFRVLKPGGYLFLTHPYMSPLRNFKARLGLYPPFSSTNKPDNFYQFALDHRSVINVFERLDFKLCLFKKGSGLSGFIEEVPFKPLIALKAYRGDNFYIKSIRYIINVFLKPFASHGCLMVFKRTLKKT